MVQFGRDTESKIWYGRSTFWVVFRRLLAIQWSDFDGGAKIKYYKLRRIRQVNERSRKNRFGFQFWLESFSMASKMFSSHKIWKIWRKYKEFLFESMLSWLGRPCLELPRDTRDYTWLVETRYLFLGEQYYSTAGNNWSRMAKELFVRLGYRNRHTYDFFCGSII